MPHLEACIDLGQLEKASLFLLKYNHKHLKFCLYFNSTSIMRSTENPSKYGPMTMPFPLQKIPEAHLTLIDHSLCRDFVVCFLFLDMSLEHPWPQTLLSC